MESNLVQNPKLLSNLPSSWSVLSFQDLVKDFSGGNKKILKSEFLDKGKYLIVDQGKKMVAGFTNDVDALVNSSPPYIIFGDHTRIFKYINVAFAMGADGTKVLKAQDDNNLNEKFLYYFFLTLNIPNTGYNRHFKYLKNSKIPLPPLAEQQKIAEILDAADALRQKDQQLIDHYTTLSQSLFLEMFGDPVTNPMGFLQSTIGEQCFVKGGKRIPKGQKLVKENTGFPYIKAGNIKKGKVTTKDLEYVSHEIREIINKYTVNEGDVCITVVGANIGDVGIVPIELHQASLTENANKLLIKNSNILSNFYLCFSLSIESIQQQIKKRTMAVGVPKLALFRIQQLQLLLPPITLQNQFADRIALIEKQKQQAQASLEQSNNLFNSLLQKAFTGELTARKMNKQKCC